MTATQILEIQRRVELYPRMRRVFQNSPWQFATISAAGNTTSIQAPTGGLVKSERLEKQIGKLEAELKEKKAQVSREKRKERTGQLVALGIMLETVFKRLSHMEKNMLNRWAEQLDPRNKQRVFAAFERLALETNTSTPTAGQMEVKASASTMQLGTRTPIVSARQTPAPYPHDL